MSNSTSLDKIEPAILEQANELARGAEILPGGLNALAERLQAAKKNKKPLRVKLGVDPTFTDLHIGHTVALRKLRQFQEYGHQVVIIIGGFTARIGDPSGRDATRPTLTDEEVQANAKTYLDQIGLVLDLKKTELTNNADWLKSLDLNQIIKLAGSVTVNQLLAKEAFGARFDKQLPISLHELLYPILQGYDSVAIKADIEFGGTDQRFNVLQGREVQMFYGQEPQLVMLMPLLEGTDGEKKMSKTYGNYIGLKDTPADMFGKCMRIPDNLIVKYFNLATSLSGKEIAAIETELAQGKNPKDIKLKLAQQMVSQYHGLLAAELELENWDKLHSQRSLPNANDIPTHEVELTTPLFRILVEAKLVSGTGEAKRLFADGGVKFRGNIIQNAYIPYGQLLDEALKNGNAGDNILQIGRRKSVLLIESQKKS
jgi:tyrosyl-tRNA synthetase